MNSSELKAVPVGFHTITPHLIIKNAADAIKFYTNAFGAKELDRHYGPDGSSVIHAVLKLGDSIVMLAEEFPDMATPSKCASPKTIGGNSVMMHIYVEDADIVFAKAISEGATGIFPMMDAFWGDRYGQVMDPYGHIWEIATHKKDLSPEEISNGAKAAFAEMCKSDIKDLNAAISTQ